MITVLAKNGGAVFFAYIVTLFIDTVWVNNLKKIAD